MGRVDQRTSYATATRKASDRAYVERGSIRYTYEKFRTYRKHYDVVNCVSDFLNMAQFLFYEISKNNTKSLQFFLHKIKTKQNVRKLRHNSLHMNAF